MTWNDIEDGRCALAAVEAGLSMASSAGNLAESLDVRARGLSGSGLPFANDAAFRELADDAVWQLEWREDWCPDPRSLKTADQRGLQRMARMIAALTVEQHSTGSERWPALGTLYKAYTAVVRADYARLYDGYAPDAPLPGRVTTDPLWSLLGAPTASTPTGTARRALRRAGASYECAAAVVEPTILEARRSGAGTAPSLQAVVFVLRQQATEAQLAALANRSADPAGQAFIARWQRQREIVAAVGEAIADHGDDIDDEVVMAIGAAMNLDRAIDRELTRRDWRPFCVAAERCTALANQYQAAADHHAGQIATWFAEYFRTAAVGLSGASRVKVPLSFYVPRRPRLDAWPLVMALNIPRGPSPTGPYRPAWHSYGDACGFVADALAGFSDLATDADEQIALRFAAHGAERSQAGQLMRFPGMCRSG